MDLLLVHVTPNQRGPVNVAVGSPFQVNVPTLRCQVAANRSVDGDLLLLFQLSTQGWYNDAR